MDKYIPELRYWFDAPAMAAVVSGGYWVLLGIIGIAPTIDSDLKWWLLGIGIFLSLLGWYSLAYSTSEADRRAEHMPELVAERVTGEINLKKRFEDAVKELAESRGNTEAELRARTHLLQTFNDVIDSLDRTVRNDVVAIATIGAINEALSAAGVNPEERIAEARKQVRDYYGKRVSGRILFPGDADNIRARVVRSGNLPA